MMSFWVVVVIVGLCFVSAFVFGDPKDDKPIKTDFRQPEVRFHSNPDAIRNPQAYQRHVDREVAMVKARWKAAADREQAEAERKAAIKLAYDKAWWVRHGFKLEPKEKV